MHMNHPSVYTIGDCFSFIYSLNRAVYDSAMMQVSAVRAHFCQGTPSSTFRLSRSHTHTHGDSLSQILNPVHHIPVLMNVPSQVWPGQPTMAFFITVARGLHAGLDKFLSCNIPQTNPCQAWSWQ